MSLNRIMLIGHLGRDPELGTLPSGEPTAKISLATSERWTDKEGKAQESTQWHTVKFIGRVAANIGQYLAKGSQVYVDGKLETRKYLTTEGVEKLAVEIRGRTCEFMSRTDLPAPAAPARPAPLAGRAHERAPAGWPERQGNRPAAARQAPAHAGSGFDDMADDLPF